MKYRKALLSENIVLRIKQLANEIEQRYGMEIEQLGCDEDHIHMLVSAHPKYAPGQLIRLFKSITGRELFKSFPELKKELWGGEFWTDGYYAATVSEKGNWGVVERYVKNQGHNIKDIQLRMW